MVLLAEKHKLLWFGPGDMPENVSSAIDGKWDVIACDSPHPHPQQFDDTEIVLIAPPADEPLDAKQLSELLDRIDRTGAVAVVLLPAVTGLENCLSNRKGQFIIADPDAPPGELSARIESAAALQPVISHLRSDVAAVRSLGVGAAGNFEQLDEEMRLAARLQRNFMPNPLPEVGPVRFAALFRPASWVSGDIYDVFRLDETHVGFYVADVVGHGMPAALLTMFIKKALQTKRIDGTRYEIIPPGKALTGLNSDICEQNLSSCQFCTAVYGIIDTENLLLQYARGGHPNPLLFDTGGNVEQLDSVGALLGVFPEETFEQQEIRLHPGHRLIVFSDGAEEMLASDSPPKVLSEVEAEPSVSTRLGTANGRLANALQDLRSLPAEQMLFRLTGLIDAHRQAGRRDDDVTVLTMDIAG